MSTFIWLEIAFGLFFITREAIGLFKLKPKRGWGRTIYDNSNFIYLLRFTNLIFMSVYFLKFSTQVCFCNYRDWFHDHCYYDELDYKQYLCYPQDRDYTQWIEDAASDYKKFTNSTEFDQYKQTIQTCIHRLSHADFVNSTNLADD